jgi:hypothetical protein
MVESRAVQEPHHDDHGHSVAAWVSVTTVMVGALISCLAVVAASTPIFVVGAVVIVAGAIAWKVLANMGYGPHGHSGRG